jgi:uncharacterized membrane protein YphA (DoxX/SURF4 family)
MNLVLASTDRVVTTGRVFFSVGLIGIGFQHFFFAQLIPVVVPFWPIWMPGRLFWVYLVGIMLIAVGGSILSGVRARLAATLLGGLFLLSVVLLHIPGHIISGAFNLGSWTDAFKALAFAGSAFVVARTLPKAGGNSDWRSPSIIAPLDKLVPFGMYPLAIMVIAFGTDHFLGPVFIATLVPAWIPGHIFWTYFAGAALIASGVGMIVRIRARLAATLLGAMLFTWVLILHIPRAVADPYGAIGNEWTSVCEALAFSGIAFILGQTLPRESGRS